MGLPTTRNVSNSGPVAPSAKYQVGASVGTPALTTRGMREPEMDLIGELITNALSAPDDERSLRAVRAEVERLCRRFPLYPV